MEEHVQVRIPVAQINDESAIQLAIERKMGRKIKKGFYKLVKRSIDARQKRIYFQLKYIVHVEQPIKENHEPTFRGQSVSDKPEVAIIGAGPAGIFAALALIEQGYRPLIFDRGKDVQSRRRDLRTIQQESKVNPESNYCFGEGGAGTYSDGKLYTRATKRGNVDRILQILVDHGAQSDILIDAHPHIGSNKLPKVIANIRATIEDCGGQYFFNHCLIDFKRSAQGIQLTFANGEKISTKAMILATGHSARDIYHLVHQKGLKMESKPFALGVRAEHAQSWLDHTQYGQAERPPELPAASYSLKYSEDRFSTFSFCMCPGGLIVPAATAPGEIVVNGMSLSRRDSPYANSGVVVTIDPIQMKAYQKYGVFASLQYQKEVEQKMFSVGDGSLAAPAQTITDFVDRKNSKSLNESSYIPGLTPVPLHEFLPKEIDLGLRKALQYFNQKMPGYITSSANLVGIESRTSAPIRIPRDAQFCHHPQMEEIYPCGEGAGYAGGIISAALDGARVVEGMIKYFHK